MKFKFDIKKAKIAAIATVYKVPNTTVKRQLLYTWFQRRPARFRSPRSFSEKTNWRVMYDRRPVMSWTCDKSKMKEFAAASNSGVLVPKTYWSGTDIAELTKVDLPANWVLKPNHRSGIVHFGHGNLTSADITHYGAITRGWLENAQTVDLGEWAYAQAERKIICEELVGDEKEGPTEYKIFVFDGEVKMVSVDTDRFGAHHGRRMYGPNWEPWDDRVGSPFHELPAAIPRPDQLNEIFRIAVDLTKPWEFMRVDLYNFHGKTYFGELTPYPGSGLDRFELWERDLELGSYWKLPELDHAS